MPTPVTRRRFAGGVLVTAAGAVMADDKPAAPDRDYPAPSFVPQAKKPKLGATLVQDFVIFGHYDLDLTKRLLEKEPALVVAAVDWGGGDFETALGGAAHMGRRDIAEFLLDHGARVDIFAAAMLGHLDVVKGLLTAHPKLIDAKGPHGFTLHWHAQAGGEQASKVLDYLQSVKKLDLPKGPPFGMKK